PCRNHIPAYRLHKQSGQAVVTLPDGFGRRRDILLGKYGTPESRKEYARVLAEWEANGRHLPQPTAASDLTVNELVLGYWKHATPTTAGQSSRSGATKLACATPCAWSASCMATPSPRTSARWP